MMRVREMYYSYVMGIDESIYELEKQGFSIEKDKKNYMITFPADKALIWEEFILKHLEFEFWNEYLTEDGIKRYDVEDFVNDNVLALCEKLCKRKFGSLKSMLEDNQWYKDRINHTY